MLPFTRMLVYANIAPQPVLKVKKYAITNNCLFALVSNGDLYGTGTNANGELGLGNTTSRPTFVKVQTGVDDVFTGNPGSQTVIIRKGTNLLYSGVSTFISGGTATTPNATLFTQWLDLSTIITASQSITDIQVVGSTLGMLINTGEFYRIGPNKGDTSSVSQLTLVQTGVQQFSLNTSNTFIIKSGVLYGTGNNTNTQINTSAISPITTFVQITTTLPVQQVCTGSSTVYMVLQDNTLWGQGTNALGALGLGNVTQNVPLRRLGTNLVVANPRTLGTNGNGCSVQTTTGWQATGQALWFGSTTDYVFSQFQNQVNINKKPVIQVLNASNATFLSTEDGLWGAGAIYFDILTGKSPYTTIIPKVV